MKRLEECEDPTIEPLRGVFVLGSATAVRRWWTQVTWVRNAVRGTGPPLATSPPMATRPPSPHAITVGICMRSHKQDTWLHVTLKPALQPTQPLTNAQARAKPVNASCWRVRRRFLDASLTSNLDVKTRAHTVTSVELTHVDTNVRRVGENGVVTASRSMVGLVDYVLFQTGTLLPRNFKP